MPSSICQSTSERSAFSSTAPVDVNGVTSAVPHPCSWLVTFHRPGLPATATLLPRLMTMLPRCGALRLRSEFRSYDMTIVPHSGALRLRSEFRSYDSCAVSQNVLDGVNAPLADEPRRRDERPL